MLGFKPVGDGCTEEGALLGRTFFCWSATTFCAMLAIEGAEPGLAAGGIEPGLAAEDGGWTAGDGILGVTPSEIPTGATFCGDGPLPYELVVVVVVWLNCWGG